MMAEIYVGIIAIMGIGLLQNVTCKKYDRGIVVKVISSNEGVIKWWVVKKGCRQKAGVVK